MTNMIGDSGKDRVIEAAKEILDARNEQEFREACRAMEEVINHYRMD